LAFITDDFVKESSTITGTGAITLAGARAPAQTFAAALANGDTFHYAVSHDTLNEWEVGVGTYNSGPNTITRSPISSSNADGLVNFTAGTKRVDLVLPAGRIRNFVGPVQIGATSFGSGTLSFSNANGVTFAMNTNSNGGTVFASVNAGGVAISAAGQSASAGTITFSNLNGVSFGMAGSAVTASVDAFRLASIEIATATRFDSATQSTVGGSILSIGRNNNISSTLMSVGNVMFGFDSSVLRAAAWVFTNGLSAQAGTFINSNNVTFGVASTTDANFGRVIRVTASASDVRLGIISHVGGNVVAGAVQVAFEDASNVTWSLSTAAGAATVRASVAAGGGGGITAFALSNAASSVMATGLTFSNANGFSFLLSTGAGAATLSGSYTVPAALAVSAAGASASAGTVVFSNSNNVSFGQAGSTVTASATVASTQASINLSAGTTSNLASQFVFSNANGVSFGLNASTITASVAAAGGFTFSGIDPLPGCMAIDNQYGQNSVAFHPVTFPNVQFDRVDAGRGSINNGHRNAVSIGAGWPVYTQRFLAVARS
jgi:hypothetical protein